MFTFSEVDRKKADMWSFAIVLWEMVTREVPFAEYSFGCLILVCRIWFDFIFFQVKNDFLASLLQSNATGSENRDGTFAGSSADWNLTPYGENDFNLYERWSHKTTQIRSNCHNYRAHGQSVIPKTNQIRMLPIENHKIIPTIWPWGRIFTQSVAF